MDWKTGKWCSENGLAADARIMITGDWAPIRVFEPIIAAAPEAIYGDLLPVLKECDLRITNLECSLTDGEGQIWKSGSLFKGLTRHITGLTAVPFEVVTTANNHVFDHGREGFEETHRVLAEHGVKAVGSGKNAEAAQKPLVVDVKGIRLGIVNFSEGEDMKTAGSGPGVFGWEVDRAAEAVRSLRSEADFVLVIAHCGVEYIPFPPPYVEKALQAMVDAGADLVIGHHPHVPQGVQLYKGVPICYCLGNFVFYQETDLVFRKTGYMVKAGISQAGLADIELIPYEIQADKLTQLRGERQEWFLEFMERISTPLTKPGGAEQAWHGFLCRYGRQGFADEIDMLMERMRSEPEKGAAMFRNRVVTMQHRQHWIDALSRMIDGTIDQAPEWSMEILEQWLTEKR